MTKLTVEGAPAGAVHHIGELGPVPLIRHATTLTEDPSDVGDIAASRVGNWLIGATFSDPEPVRHTACSGGSV